MRRVLMGIAILWAGPALAVELAFIGKWAETADAKCSEPLLITETTMEALARGSWQCLLAATTPWARSWTKRMMCLNED